MKGADELAPLFLTGQYGRLYIVSGHHARGLTFSIYVLPLGEKAISNGSNTAPLNEGALEVYGAISGTLGWTESYGWLHAGPWCYDFQLLVRNKKELLCQEEKQKIDNQKEEEEKKARHKKELVDRYCSDYYGIKEGE